MVSKTFCTKINIYVFFFHKVFEVSLYLAQLSTSSKGRQETHSYSRYTLGCKSECILAAGATQSYIVQNAAVPGFCLFFRCLPTSVKQLSAHDKFQGSLLRPPCFSHFSQFGSICGRFRCYSISELHLVFPTSMDVILT